MPRKRLVTLVILSLLAVGSLGILPHWSLRADDNAERKPSVAIERKEASLPLPSRAPRKREQVVRELYDFVVNRRYESWERDRHVRDTGDYIEKIYYGTHPAVRVYYSPAVMAWLRKGDRSQPIADGAMIVKEQFKAPAARWEGKDDKALRAGISGWTLMLRDSHGSKDGWYWADFGLPNADGTPALPKNPHAYPFSYISTGFGQDCIRCHASAGGQSTFAELSNIDGKRPHLTFRVDDSWRSGAERTAMEKLYPQAAVLSMITSTEGGSSHDLGLTVRLAEHEIGHPRVEADPEFLRLFNEVAPVSYRTVQVIPNETYDRIVPGSPEKTAFFTSDQCMACHSGLADPFRAMFFNPGKPEAPLVYGNSPEAVNVSPFGEWRWSMMGLAGRDPVFYAQMASELKLHGRVPDAAARIANSCLSCHGVMGQRQFQSDHGFDKALTEGGNLHDSKALPIPFEPSVVSITDPGVPNFKYGALTREGISCMACHRIQDPRIDEKGGQGLPDLIMARFRVGSKIDEVFGPYADAAVVTVPIKNATGLTPRYNAQITKSRLCASCHVLRVPVFKADGTTIKENGSTDEKLHFEQATYLEWLNSAYQDEYGGASPTSKSCQQCHMPGDYRGKKLQERIATIEDDTYPAADERADLDQIRVRVRDKFSRHELLGINVNVLEMFDQFEEILGVRKIDYMTGSAEGLRRAIDNAVRQAEKASAEISVSPLKIDGSDLVTDVQVRNLTGHRFPSGVGFRSAFVEFSVFDTRDNRDRLLWASGRTNGLGVIVDQTGKPVPTEFFDENVRGERYQPHFSTSIAISRQDQAQIFEQVTENPEGQITTSFLALFKTLKDNRLLPKGWTLEGPPGADLPEGWIMATHPVGTDQDKTFTDGRGAATLTYRVPLRDLEGGDVDLKQLEVVATLYYQSIPPNYLKDRFKDAPDDPATKRLHYLTSHLDLSKTPVKGWKLRIASAGATWSERGTIRGRE